VRMFIREVNAAVWVRFAIYNYKLYKLRILNLPMMRTASSNPCRSASASGIERSLQ
jgi:hypothetical protein